MGFRQSVESLSHLCDLTMCDLQWGLLPVFITFHNHSKGVGGLVSERCANLGTLKSDLVGESRTKIGSHRSDL